MPSSLLTLIPDNIRGCDIFCLAMSKPSQVLAALLGMNSENTEPLSLSQYCLTSFPLFATLNRMRYASESGKSFSDILTGFSAVLMACYNTDTENDDKYNYLLFSWGIVTISRGIFDGLFSIDVEPHQL